MSKTIAVAVLGAAGRMGQAVIAALAQQSTVSLSAAVVREGDSRIGEAVVQMPNQQYCAATAVDWQATDAIIDFSSVAAVSDHLALASRHRCPIVLCTTGLSESQQRLIDTTANNVAVLPARNTSVGIALLEKLTELATATLPDIDIEIAETHHKHKKDAPSGTAIALAEAASRGAGLAFNRHQATPRGEGEREAGSIGFAVTRAADIVGEHSVLLARLGERMILEHRVSDRKIFADGAIKAAQWLAHQTPGRYQMSDVLGLNHALQRLLAE
ncbi:4-hydroxy-tetrahydrodipicolinate reductase [Idiomarina tyrosinivorans]|uniref:4-hydroxy-tetrahydrodipicolinate reductase n=1 Tax=Idiomarina tyrosinivorans TaxID=1445662 RepID=UPI001F54382D|nr:4-hydroxy-tetrahydrodipicolinate reductase [Idiomarina tyrosinivorans]